MSVVSKTPGHRHAVRVVREDAVVIDGRTYRPLSDDVAYTGQLEGHCCLFGHYIAEGRSYSNRIALWGVWDPDEREYLSLKGPHIVDGRFSFVEWAVDED